MQGRKEGGGGSEGKGANERQGRPITVIAATNRPTTAINTSERLALQMSL